MKRVELFLVNPHLIEQRLLVVFNLFQFGLELFEFGRATLNIGLVALDLGTGSAASEFNLMTSYN